MHFVHENRRHDANKSQACTQLGLPLWIFGYKKRYSDISQFSPFSMLATPLILFIAGLLTILLPCILPLIPIVLGVSITDKNKLQPLVTVTGMLLSFVGSVFLLQVVLSQFIELANIIRLGTFDVLFLFGLGFATHRKDIRLIGAALPSLFFVEYGWQAVLIALIINLIAMELGGRVATAVQQFGTNVQTKTREEFGGKSLLTAFIVGLTMGLVWVPCAGPALGFALSLVRDEPGLRAFLYLTAYGVGAGLPLLAIGYGGQYAVHSVRALTKYSGRIKQVSGIILMVTALLFYFHTFEKIQTWLLENTSFGNIGVDIEESLFEDGMPVLESTTESSSTDLPKLSIKGKAAALIGLGTWHNSNPLTSEDLKGKVVLIDFWTYSCINCIRTLPYIQGYWEKYGSDSLTTGADTPFVLLGIHTPEFVFEKSDKNVANAIKKHGLTYPVAQDNDFATWDAFKNRYWPAKYLIDAQGNIRYTHFGEGDYEETDKAIASLLAEIGVKVENPGVVNSEAIEGTERRARSPEVYVGERSWDHLQNAQGDPSTKVISYKEPCMPSLHQFCLIGDWQLIESEQQTLKSPTGEIKMKFLGTEANLVFGLADGVTSAEVDVFIDNAKTKTLKINENDLQNVFTGAYGEHDLVLKIRGAGVNAYAFTFGA